MNRTPRDSFIDLSHEIEDGMITYKGLPAPKIASYLSREESRSHYSGGTEFFIGTINMVANTGTYLDTPFHRYDNGKDLSEIGLWTLANIEGVLIKAPNTETRRIDATRFQSVDVRHKAVLIETNWDKYWRTDKYFEEHSYLTADAADYLVDRGATLVGIDSLNIDDTTDGMRPVHTKLLGAGVPIVEHLCSLDRLPLTGFKFFAVPPKVKGLGTFPVRCFALVPK